MVQEWLRQCRVMERLIAFLLWPVADRILSFLTVSSAFPESDTMFMMVWRMVPSTVANRICSFVDDRNVSKRVMRGALLRKYLYEYVGRPRDLQGDTQA